MVGYESWTVHAALDVAGDFACPNLASLGSDPCCRHSRLQATAILSQGIDGLCSR